MNAFSGRPTGAGGCQFSMIAQSRSCRRVAKHYRTTPTGVTVALCHRHEDTHGRTIGITQWEVDCVARTALATQKEKG